MSDPKSKGSQAALVMRPIGYVRSPFSDTSQIPKGAGAEHTALGTLELLPRLEPGLQDIEGFSHLLVVWAFHRSRGHELLAQVPLDAERVHGVFATRSPRRPNPIGISVVELLGRHGARLEVRGVDMLDGTPILDLKPYLSSVPAEKLRRGWVAEAETRRRHDPRAEAGPPAGGPAPSRVRRRRVGRSR